ncbi:MAG: phage terminase large subunit family protein, partial [Lentisphaerae bacterium]|nr:phage terminase large subunit family protein [Lentisphaerota bacterium]
MGGDSGLLDMGTCVPWEDLDRIASKSKGVGASHVLIDAGYGERTQEVYEACWKYRMIPTMGKENIQELLFVESAINPFEGKRKASKKYSIGILYFRTDPFKTQLMRRVRGEADHAWWVYHDVEAEYGIHMTSEQRDERGFWDWRPGNARRNHWWDDEVLQIL